jgi:GDP-L-fucose synthase
MDDEQWQAIAGVEQVPLLNVGWGEDITINELAHMIKDIAGFTGKIVFDETKPDGPARKMLDVTRFTELGWSPEISLRAGLKAVIKEYQGL